MLDLFEQIAPSERDSLLAFAEFLSQRRSQEAVVVERNSSLEPKPLERPGDESVVKAIKRLSESYFMLERDRLLDETSSLMTSHIMQGRAAVEVIDDLEALFKKHYQDYLSNS
ncbi:MAG: hypothetical protein KUF72_19930 [Candidatus Thiodiazotropha sp. (ex Ctena orbiculata)]|nr:hypothetical protein [Candidatus Thiodiazotropha taylori]